MISPSNTRSRRMAFGLYDYALFTSFFAYAAGSVVVPVALVALARDLDFSLEAGGMTAGGGLHFGRTVPMMAGMLLCGFAAGFWGKRRTLGTAVALMAVGLLLCSMAPAYALLLLALMVAGFAEGIIEGLATPFVQVLHPDEPGRYINFTHAFWSVGIMIPVLLVGGLMSLGVGWRIPVAGTAVLAALAAALLFVRPRRQAFPEHPEPVHWRTICGQARAILRCRGFWLFFAAMFVAGGGEFCLTFWCASFIQLNFVDAAWAGGVGTACFAGGMVLGRTGWGYLIRQHQLRRLIIWSALAGTLITLSFPHLENLWVLFALLFLSGVATAPFWPSVQSYSADRLPEADTTMLFILLSCAGIPGCGVFTWLMGYIGDRVGLAPAFYLVPACYLALAGLIGYDAWRLSAAPRPSPAIDQAPV